MTDSEEDYSGSEEEDSEVRHDRQVLFMQCLIQQIDDEDDLEEHPSSKRPRVTNRFIIDEAGESALLEMLYVTVDTCVRIPVQRRMMLRMKKMRRSLVLRQWLGIEVSTHKTTYCTYITVLYIYSSVPLLCINLISKQLTHASVQIATFLLSLFKPV